MTSFSISWWVKSRTWIWYWLEINIRSNQNVETEYSSWIRRLILSTWVESEDWYQNSTWWSVYIYLALYLLLMTLKLNDKWTSWWVTQLISAQIINAWRHEWLLVVSCHRSRNCTQRDSDSCCSRSSSAMFLRHHIEKVCHRWRSRMSLFQE